MSKVRIYGDTSGYIDVAAPATADNSTLDLSTVIPNGTDITVSSQGLKVEGSRRLSVGGSNAGGYLENNFGNDDLMNLVGKPSGMRFLKSDLSVEHMKIDSSGRVTMPYQPSFALNVLGGQTYGTGWQTITLTGHTSTFIQGGITLSNSNTRITVPVSGVYHIEGNVTFSVGNSNTDGTLSVRKNGSDLQIGASNAQTDANHGSTSISFNVSLSANDYLELKSYQSPSNMTTRDTNFAGYFSGHLVG